MSDLKPCPFCGNADVEPYRSGSDNHYVECPQCGTFGPDCESRQEAIDTWNARTEVQSAISAAVQAEREACAKIAEESWDGEGIADDIRARTAPAVDVLAVVREYVEASEAFDAAYVDPASGVELGKRLDTKWHALRALVDGGLQS